MKLETSRIFDNKPCNECGSTDEVKAINIAGNIITLCCVCRNDLIDLLEKNK